MRTPFPAHPDAVAAAGTNPIQGVGLLQELQIGDRVVAVLLANGILFTLDTAFRSARANVGDGRFQAGDRVAFSATPAAIQGTKVVLGSLVLREGSGPDQVDWAVDRWTSDARALSGQVAIPIASQWVDGKRVWHTKVRAVANLLEFSPA